LNSDEIDFFAPPELY
jgi:hypothetical protein